MRPAFSSSRQALAFVLLLAGILGLPGFVAKLGVLRSVEVHVSRKWQFGPFNWIDWQVHHRTNDVDVAFLGSSRLFAGVNAAIVKEQLSAQLGRPAEVFTLGWHVAGYDALYAVARDLLAHRKVRMLVIYDDCYASSDKPNPFSYHWYRPGADPVPVALLPWLERVRLYAGSLLSVPRFMVIGRTDYRGSA